MNPARAFLAGVVLMFAGLAGYVYAHDHRPGLDPIANRVLATNVYDMLHYGAYVLAIIGVLTVCLALARNLASDRA
jgi:hypothetical protein